MTWPPAPSRAGLNAVGAAGLAGAVVPDDVEEGLQPGLHAGVGGVGVDFENQVGLGAHLGGQHASG